MERTNDEFIPQLRILLRPQLQRRQELGQNRSDENDRESQQQIRLYLTFRRQSEVGFSDVEQILDTLEIDGEEGWIHIQSSNRFGDVLSRLLLPEIRERSVEESVRCEGRQEIDLCVKCQVYAFAIDLAEEWQEEGLTVLK